MITLHTLSQATEQQVFDQVVNHLRKQATRSVNEDGDCSYRGNFGLMCAAGCLIGDDEYNPDWDESGGTTWCTLVDQGDINPDHHDLICELQSVHDLYFDDKEDHFKELAETFKLKYKGV